MSSMQIGILVYAEDKAEANAKALEVVTDLCAREVFHGHREMKIMTVDSKRGQAFIQERLGVQKQEFMGNLQSLRKHLAYTTDEKLWQLRYTPSAKIDSTCMRHRAWSVGQYEGDHIKLYDNDGAGIQEPEHLQDVLDGWACIHQGKSNPYDNLKIYVASVGVST